MWLALLCIRFLKTLWRAGKARPNAIGNLMVRLIFKSGLSFFFDLRGLLVWLAVSLCLGVVASFLPAWRASRQSVREAVGYE